MVSGLPGSGKTTVARELAARIGLPLLDKDDFLARLFDERGVGDAARRRRLSRESDALLQAAAMESDGAVVCSFWRGAAGAGAAADSGTPTEWLRALSPMLVNVHCACPPEVAADRFVRRVRHPGHLDAARSPAEVLASLEALAPLVPLGIGETLIVDTTGHVDGVALARRVEESLQRLRHGPGAS